MNDYEAEQALPSSSLRRREDEASSSSSSSSLSLPLPTTVSSSLASTNLPSLCCAFLASITTGGTTYAFGLYGSALKRNLHLTQGQLDTISTANFCAGLFSWIPGLLVDRYGTRFGIVSGGILGACHLMGFYWTATAPSGDDNKKNELVAVLSALQVGIFLSCALVTGSVFKIIVGTCGPGSKGSAVGIAKGFVGLGAGFYAVVFESIKSSSSSQQQSSTDLDFLPLAATLFVAAASVPSALVLPGKASSAGASLLLDVTTPLHFRVMYTSFVVLAAIVVGSSMWKLHQEQRHDHQEEENRNWFLTLLLLTVWVGPIVSLLFLPQRSLEGDNESDIEEEQEALLLARDDDPDTELPSMIPAKSRMTESPATKRKPTVSPPTSEDNALAGQGGLDDLAINSEDEEVSRDDLEEEPRILQENPNKNLLEMLSTPSAWLMLWTTTILVGGGTVETNNMGQMVESLDLNPLVTPTALAFFSVAQAAGRVATGSMSEAARTWGQSGIPRPMFLVVASAAGVLAHGLLAVGGMSEALFLMGVLLSGYAFGMVWPLMVLVVGEVFGTAHVAANYMFFDGFTSAAGTVLLSKVVAQQVYERHISPSDNNTDDQVTTTCYGVSCFQTTHFVIAIFCATCVFSSLWLVRMTRHLYQKTPIHRQ